MTVTNSIVGPKVTPSSRPVQDFGLCNAEGGYIYSAKLRAKGLVVVTFFDPDNLASRHALSTVTGWSARLPQQKWSAVGIAATDPDTMKALAAADTLDTKSLLLDHEAYQARMWGISQIPSTFLISGKTGRVIRHVTGYAPEAFEDLFSALSQSVDEIVAAEEAAKAAAQKAEEEKKAAEAAKPAPAKA